MLQLSHFGSAKPFSWTNKHLVQLLTQGKNPVLTDPFIINAFRKIDRGDFLPESHRELAYHDRLINIGFGQVSTNPTLVARKLQILNPKFGGRYLHIGTGMGYFATLLSFLIGDTGTVYSMERNQWLWEEARKRSTPYREKDNLDLQILYRNGSDGLPQKAPFDGIIFSFVPNEFPRHMLEQLAVGGMMMLPTPQHTLHIVTRSNINNFEEEVLTGFNAYAYGKQELGID